MNTTVVRVITSYLDTVAKTNNLQAQNWIDAWVKDCGPAYEMAHDDFKISDLSLSEKISMMKEHVLALATTMVKELSKTADFKVAEPNINWESLFAMTESIPKWEELSLKAAAETLSSIPAAELYIHVDEDAAYAALKEYVETSNLSEDEFKQYYIRQVHLGWKELQEDLQEVFRGMKRVYDRIAKEKGFSTWNYGEMKWEEIGA